MMYCDIRNLDRYSEGPHNAYRVDAGDAFCLIDCPVSKLPSPAPSVVLHTHVQAEHCREWAACPDVDVYVPAGCVDLATCSAAYRQACRQTWPLDREWEYRGREPYGHTGCVTARPPQQALNVVGELAPGNDFSLPGVTFQVLALPGSDSRAVGLYWVEEDVLFCGDLLCNDGRLVNMYDLERDYGLGAGFRELRESLLLVRRLRPRLLLPATGPPIADPVAAVDRLLAGLGRVLDSPLIRGAAEPEADANFAPRREFGRYREILPGLYQNNNHGAMVLFVDEQGRGLLVDPDFCVWLSWEENCREFHADLDCLEKETGLKRVEWAVISHPHGDHLEYAGLLRDRYHTRIMAVRDTALLLSKPNEFNYPGLLPWFDLSFDSFEVDACLDYGQSVNWHGTPITPVWTPGHCNVHAGYLVDWHGHRVITTGDFLQYGAGPVRPGFPIVYNDTAWPGRGPQYSLRKLRALQPEFYLSNHGHACWDPDQSILDDFIAVFDQAAADYACIVPDGDLEKAMTPPGFDELRRRHSLGQAAI